MLVPCGDNVLLRREAAIGPLLIVNETPDTAIVMAGADLPPGCRVVLRRGCDSLRAGDEELVALSDILAIVE
jgi:hypothetical protein